MSKDLSNKKFRPTSQQINVIIILFFGTFVSFFNQATINPALPTIMETFDISASTAQWLFSGYTLVTAIMIPINASIVERYSVRKIFICAMSAFTVGCVLTAAGPAFGVILLGRLIQGMGSGVLMPTCITTLFVIFPKDKRGAIMGTFGLVIGFAPVLGPVVSGFICDNASWHWIYIITGVLSLISVFFGFVLMKEENLTEINTQRLDKLSVILSTVGFGLLLFGFGEVGSNGLTWYSVSSMIVGLIVTILFFVRQMRIKNPMLRVDVLKNKKFRYSVVIISCVQMAIMGNTVIIPLLIQDVMGQSATVSGLVMMPAALVLGILSPFSGKYLDKHGARKMSIAGLSLLSITTIFLCFIDENFTAIYLMVVLILRYIALAIVNMPVNTWGVNCLEKDEIPHGNSVASSFRQTAGSFGTAITVSVFSIIYHYLMDFIPPLDAGLWGINSAFMFQSVICIIALVIAIIFVKDDNKNEK